MRRLVTVLTLLTVFVLTALAAACGSEDGPAAPALPPGSLPVDYIGFAHEIELSPDDVPGMELVENGVRLLQGPHFVYAVSGVGVVEGELPAVLRRAYWNSGRRPEDDAKAAPGHELVLVQVTSSRVAGRVEAAEGRPERVEVVAGTAKRATPGDFSGVPGVLVFSVPAGERAALSVTDEDRTQTLDVRTLKRDADAVAGYYPIRAGEVVRTYSDTGSFFVRTSGRGVSGVAAGSRFAGIHLDEMQASLVPWIEDGGWAPAGKLWLVAFFAVTAQSVEGVDENIIWSFEPEGFRLSGPDGAAIATREKKPVVAHRFTQGYGRLTALVPSSLKSATLTFTPVATAKTDSGKVSYAPYRPRPQVIKVKLR